MIFKNTFDRLKSYSISLAVLTPFYVTRDYFKITLRDEWFNRKIQRDVLLEPSLCHPLNRWGQWGLLEPAKPPKKII